MCAFPNAKLLVHPRGVRHMIDPVALWAGTSAVYGAERAFGFGDENWLCWACAEARGGRYDARREQWERAPDVSGLPDEAYGASPHEIRRGR